MDTENPYAASSVEELPPARAQADSLALAWNPTEIFSVAWDRFREYWVVLFLAVLLSAFLSGFPKFLAQFTISYAGLELQSEATLALSYGSRLVGWLIECYLSVGLTRLFLQAARGEQSPEFGVLFSGFDRFLSMAACLFVLQSAITLGLVLLIVPAVFFGCVFFVADFLVVDRQLGPLRALSTSWELTRGHRMNIVVIGVFGLLAGLLGLVACLIGVFAAKALFGVCSALIYIRLTGEHTRGSRVRFAWE